MTELNDFLNIIDTQKIEQNKREYLSDNLSKISSKTPWTIERLNKASDKVIDKLYDKVNNNKVNDKVIEKDLLSKISGVDNFEKMMQDVNSNYLIKNSTSEIIGNLAPSINIDTHTPMEILGSHIYEKCGIYLAPVSLFCTIFNHLDWKSFDQIAKERLEETINNNSNILNDEVLD